MLRVYSALPLTKILQLYRVYASHIGLLVQRLLGDFTQIPAFSLTGTAPTGILSANIP